MAYYPFASLFALVLVAAPARPASDLCASFKKADVAAVLGTDVAAGAVIIPGSCSWNTSGKNLTITRAQIADTEEGRPLVDAFKSGAQRDEVVKDEPALGDRAASRADANGRTVTLVAVSGTVVWNATLTAADQRIDVAAALPRLRDLIKAVITTR